MKIISGKCIPLTMDHVDTDMIIPAQYLTSIEQQGYGRYLFQRLKDQEQHFVFNDLKFQDATILLTGNNFGCGSSREHAVWALKQAGIQAVIAPSFADIFKNNAIKNHLLLIELPQAILQPLQQQALSATLQLKINLESCVITSSQDQIIYFSIDEFTHYLFIHEIDELNYLLKQQEKISNFKKQQVMFLTMEDK